MLPKHEAGTLYLRLSRELRQSFLSARDELARRPADCIVHLGDVTYGWDRGGMDHPSLLETAAECMRSLRSLGAPVYVCIGNHDTGEIEDGEERFLRNIELCERTFGSLTWSHESHGLLHIGLATPLSEYVGENPAILRRVREQEIFLRTTLARNEGRPWILYAHEPSGLQLIAPLLRPHLRTLRRVVCGHFHRPLVGQWIRTTAHLRPAHPVFDRSAYTRLMRKVTVCPSSAPLWWRGYGILGIHRLGNRVVTREHHVLRPDGSEPLFTSSLVRCLWLKITERKQKVPVTAG